MVWKEAGGARESVRIDKKLARTKESHIKKLSPFA